MGGEFSAGRWHTPAKGKRVVYLAEHPALALVETLVNLKANPNNLPEAFQLIRVEAPGEIAIETVASEALAEGWRDDPSPTQTLGDRWLHSRSSALLAVPSAPAPESTNYLLNPLHPAAGRVTLTWARRIRYDRRLFLLSGAKP
jgi:RES domain-containing protein